MANCVVDRDDPVGTDTLPSLASAPGSNAPEIEVMPAR